MSRPELGVTKFTNKMPAKIILTSMSIFEKVAKEPSPTRVVDTCESDWFFINQIKGGKSVEEARLLSYMCQDKVYKLVTLEPNIFTERVDRPAYVKIQVEKYASVFDTVTRAVTDGKLVRLEDLPVVFSDKLEGVRAVVRDGFIELWITIRRGGGYNCEDWYQLYHKYAEISATNKHGERLLSRCDHGTLDFQAE